MGTQRTQLHRPAVCCSGLKFLMPLLQLYTSTCLQNCPKFGPFLCFCSACFAPTAAPTDDELEPRVTCRSASSFLG